MRRIVVFAGILAWSIYSPAALADDGVFDTLQKLKELWTNTTTLDSKALSVINEAPTSPKASQDQDNQTLSDANKVFNQAAPQFEKAALKSVLPPSYSQTLETVDGAQNLYNKLNSMGQAADQWAQQKIEDAEANLQSMKQTASDVAATVEKYFSSGYDNGLESGGLDQSYVTQTGGAPFPPSTLDTMANNGATGASPPAATSSLTSSDLAAIGARNTSPTSVSTSLSSDAQQLPGQLSA